MWPYSSGWGYYPSGGLGLVVLILVILAVSGRLWPLARRSYAGEPPPRSSAVHAFSMAMISGSSSTAGVVHRRKLSWGDDRLPEERR